jgi:hypothetical protein
VARRGMATVYAREVAAWVVVVSCLRHQHRRFHQFFNGPLGLHAPEGGEYKDHSAGKGLLPANGYPVRSPRMEATGGFAWAAGRPGRSLY